MKKRKKERKIMKRESKNEGKKERKIIKRESKN